MTQRRSEASTLVWTSLLLLTIYLLTFVALVPNESGAVGNDYSLWLPDLLVGYFWHLNNGWFSLPWFSPAQCGGVPFYADPQVGYLSLPQLLTFMIPPVEAVQVSVLFFAIAGYLGAYYLSRIVFRTSAPAALLAGSVFMFNSFYWSRMLVGHLTYQSFMLVPALAATLLPRVGVTVGRYSNYVALSLGGIIIAIFIQGGAVHVLAPAILTVATVIVMHGIRFGSVAPAAFRLVGAALIGCALSAGKLASAYAFMVNFPRDQYSLPGIDGLRMTVWRALQTLFLGPPQNPETDVVNSMWAIQRHEWEYCVSIIPLLLMLCWAVRSLSKGPVRHLRGGLWVTLFLLLAFPIALNWYQPSWNSFLKMLPLIGSMSNPLRWFCAYIPVASLASSLALDSTLRPRFRAVVSGAAIASIVSINVTADLSYYGPSGQGRYSVAAIESAWYRARDARTGPRVTEIRAQIPDLNRSDVSVNRQDAFIYGYSQLDCYEPMFGYRLERFPIGALHTGAALASNGTILNVKNPACYVFPGVNSCVLGDHFSKDRTNDAEAFLDYEPFHFEQPLWARLAVWLSLFTACALSATLLLFLFTVSIPSRLAGFSRVAGNGISPWIHHGYDTFLSSILNFMPLYKQSWRWLAERLGGLRDIRQAVRNVGPPINTQNSTGVQHHLALPSDTDSISAVDEERSVKLGPKSINPIDC